jgi:hypothetical protein
MTHRTFTTADKLVEGLSAFVNEGFTIKQWKTVDGYRKRRQRMQPVIRFIKRWLTWRARDFLITKKLNLIAQDLLKSIVGPKETFLPGDEAIVQSASQLITTLEQITVCVVSLSLSLSVCVCVCVRVCVCVCVCIESSIHSINRVSIDRN